MKKIFTFIMVFAFLFISIIHADGYGIKFGINHSKLVPFEYKQGFLVGAYYRIDLRESFSLQPELYYSQEGTSYSDMVFIGIIPVNRSMKVSLDYVHVPILMKLKMNNGKKASHYLFCGPYFSIGTKAIEIIKVSTPGIELKRKENYNNILSVHLGFAIGLENSINIGKHSIVIDLRFRSSFIDDDNVDLRCSVFSASLGYGFNK